MRICVNIMPVSVVGQLNPFSAPKQPDDFELLTHLAVGCHSWLGVIVHWGIYAWLGSVLFLGI